MSPFPNPLTFSEWYSHSRGGRLGGPNHQAIVTRLEGRNTVPTETEVGFGPRFADAVDKKYIHQVGDLNSRGDPIARERDAISEIMQSAEYKPNPKPIKFWDKNNPDSKRPAVVIRKIKDLDKFVGE